MCLIIVPGYIVSSIPICYVKPDDDMEMESGQRQPKLKPRIVAVIGPKAAGKDELARYLREQYNVLAIEVGNFARELAGESNENQAHLQYDTVVQKLAECGTEYIITRLVMEIVKSGEWWANALVVTGVRTPAEAMALKAHFGPDMLLIYVRVGNLETRYQRVKERDFPTDPDDFQTFAVQDETLKEEYSLAQTAELADATLWNNDSLDNFYQQIEERLVRHLFPNAVSQL